MITLEQVEKLKDYAKVSYEDAKLALEATNGDMLEAVIYLEKIGKISSPKNGGEYSTEHSTSDEYEFTQETKSTKEDGSYSYTEEDFKKQSKKFGDTISSWLRKGAENYFEVSRKGRVMISVPILVLLLALLFFFWITLPLMVVGLFCGCSYHFKGPDLKSGNDPLNQAMNVAKGSVEQVKTSFEDEKK